MRSSCSLNTVAGAEGVHLCLTGLIADVTKNYLRLPRSFCIIIVASLFVISQVTLYTTEDPDNLWKASAVLGIAYGSLFGLFPTITIEWFGLRAYHRICLGMKQGT